jgi:tetratricopeptide (TPR) repeat protein
MMRFPLRSAVIALTLGLLCTAQAQDDDRSNREERRALRASDFETVNQSEEYRQLARQKRHESMEFLKDILANRAPVGEQKAEMMLRLADLYFEEGRDIYLTEMQTYQDLYDACFNDPNCSVESYPDADNDKSEAWQERSIKLYKAILQNYPQYARADEATFYLAGALQELKRAEEAVGEYNRLVRTYPDSGFVPDSYVQIGEFYFENNNAYQALLAYQKAARYKNHDKYSFAIYKLAWCYYNVGEYGKAIDTMKAVVAYSMTPQEGQESRRLTLQDEALKDLVRFFADAGEMDEAYAYFNKLGKKELIRSMLKRLAGMYFEQGKFDECIATYRRLIAEDPNSSNSPDYQNEIIQAYQKTNRKEETLTEIERMRTTYGGQSPWARANSGDPDALKAAEEYLEKSLRQVALNYHSEAKRYSGRMARETFSLAEQAYSVYLQEFPDGQNSYEMRYAYGELLYKLKKYDMAYEQYMSVVKTDPNGRRSKFCANSAVYAAEEMSKTDLGPENPQGNIDPVEMSDWEKKYLSALDQYSSLYPDDSDTPGAIYKAGYLLYNHNLFRDSSERFRIVISMQPGSRDAMTAANLILDSLAQILDYATLRDTAKAFFDQQGLGNNAFKTEVFEIYEGASFQLIEETFKKDNDQKVAADAYMAFVNAFEGSKRGDIALNNAAVYYFATENYREAMDARLKLIEAYPESQFFKSQLASIGFAYESMADFSTAAEYYEQLFELDREAQEQEGTQEAIYSAALFRNAMGDWQGAVKDYRLYIEQYPDDARNAGLLIDIARLYASNGEEREAANLYKAFFSQPPESSSIDQVFFTRLEYGLQMEAAGQAGSRLDDHYAETIAAFTAAQEAGQTMEFAPIFIAQIMFKQAQPVLDAYMAMDISGPNRPMSEEKTNEIVKNQLFDKARSLLNIEVVFTDIISVGAGEWGLASLVALGQAYDNMGAAMLNSFVPAYLTEDQKEIFFMRLEDQAYVQEEKAVNAYQLALGKAFEFNLYNSNTAFATRQLGVLRPDEYPVLDEQLIVPRFTAASSTTRSILERAE